MGKYARDRHWKNIDLDHEPFFSGEPHLKTQSKLNDPVRYLSFSKTIPEVLGSRPK